MIQTVVNPRPHNALRFIKNYHKGKADKTMLIIGGDCLVDYRGRARSLLDWGERVVMIKEDGTVLVHRSQMREPVNWQPATSKTEFKVEDNSLVLRSRHSHPPEKMKIIFRGVKFMVSTTLRDRVKLAIVGMETDIVNQLISNPNIIEEGLRISKREKHIRSGIIDLFGYDQQHVPVVIEVKRSLANISSVQQLRMYVNEVKQDVETASVRGILCAPRVPDMVKRLLSDYDLEWCEVERSMLLADDWQKTLKDF